MERYFCNGKKDFCDDSTGCAKCNHKNGDGGFWENDVKNVFAYYFGDGYDLYRLRELVQADRDGRCVVLPCKPGDTVYQADAERIYELGIRKIIYDCGHIAFDIAAVGKSVFLTREEAEEELRRLSDED